MSLGVDQAYMKALSAMGTKFARTADVESQNYREAHDIKRDPESDDVQKWKAERDMDTAWTRRGAFLDALLACMDLKKEAHS